MPQSLLMRQPLERLQLTPVMEDSGSGENNVTLSLGVCSRETGTTQRTRVKVCHFSHIIHSFIYSLDNTKNIAFVYILRYSYMSFRLHPVQASHMAFVDVVL